MESRSDNPIAHHSTVELANCKLRLRSDLAFHLQEYQGAQCYLIEDEFNSRFYRVGLPEYHLISLLDGSTTISKAVSRTAAQMGDQAISEQDAITICKWLIDSELASTDASRSSGRILESFHESDRKKRKAQLNPVTPKFPLFNPDALLTQLTALLGWIFSFPMFVLWCGIMGMAIYQVTSHWDMISGSQSMVLSRDNWIWLGLTWILLKLLHETAHGLACKRFSGDVRQCGIVLIVMIPLPFVDVTSSWRFPSKWQRIYVAAAGMYVELFLAALAAIVWSYSDVGLVRQHAFNVMLAGSLTTVLFNANPLMRSTGGPQLVDITVAGSCRPARIADDEFRRQLQSHLLEVTRAYWSLYLERGTLFQKMSSYKRANEIYQMLEKRSDIDAQPSQIVSAKASATTRYSELIRARMAVKNGESRLRSLVNDPAFGECDEIEIIPVDAPAMTQLDLITQTYVAGLEGNGSIGDAYAEQFSAGRPGYSVGVNYQIPVGNRAACARNTRRRPELRQLKEQYQTTLQTVKLEVEVAVREIQTSSQEMTAKYQAMDARTVQLDVLTKRWESIPGEDISASLALELARRYNPDV